MNRLKRQAAFWLSGASILLIFGLIPALAAPVTFSANTSGKFGAGSTGGTVSPSGSSITVGPATINFTSLPSEINVGLNPGQSSNVTLGVFNATSNSVNSATVAGATFNLSVTFTLPNDASPSPATYTANITGTISSGASGASVVWANNSITFMSPTAGTFTLTLEPSTPINSPLSPDASRIRGTITYNTAIPEPLTLLTLGSGLAGLAALTGRRRKKD